MAFDMLKLITAVLPYFLQLGLTRVYQRILASFHYRSYKALPDAQTQNIVIIGGSFAGLQLSRRLSETIPTGYRIIVIEKNSHFNFSWVFPRFSVIPGYEDQAFIPYSGFKLTAPAGSWSHVQDECISISATNVTLASGIEIPYTYLAVAAGTSSSPPARVLAIDSKDGSAELRSVQQHIKKAVHIAVIGGGAVGIEFASDIKSFYPEKEVVLYHSRSQLLPAFGERLHKHVELAFQKLDIKVVYNERPECLPDGISLRTSKGIEKFDMIIPCTGQRPNSQIVQDFAPSAVSSTTNRILVQPTLQLLESKKSDGVDLSHIFALGDIAETGAPKMSLSAQDQAEIVAANIISMIAKRKPKAIYKSRHLLEGIIKLTLGKKDFVLYGDDSNGGSLLISSSKGKEDMGIKNAWWWMSAKYKKDADVVNV